MKNMTTSELYNALIKLTEGDADGKFFYNDFVTPLGEHMRVFSYHIASYSDWLIDGAIECRGILFETDADGEFIRIVSRPMEKFFNLNENPFTMGLDLSKTEQLMDKADGSLISTYLTGDNFALKSKTSIFSEQANAANRYIKQPENINLWEFCDDLTKVGYTVNMEWVAPNNRIVLEYNEPKLVILNIRHNETGEYLDFNEIPRAAFHRIANHIVDEYDPSQAGDENFVENLKAQKGIEGVVGRLESGQSYKIKTTWYVDLHSQKDSVNVPKKLVTTILNNNHDDLYALFSDDKLTIERIRDFETHVVSSVRKSWDDIRAFYTENRSKDRKDFAILGQKALQSWEFGIAMKAYQAQSMENVHEMLIQAYLRKPDILVPEKYLNEV